MLQTTLTCGKCGSTAVRKNGSLKGQAKYQCTACRYQAVFSPAAPGKARTWPSCCLSGSRNARLCA
ncbi:IS1/IS1595 family N-terminal zinc-binding domain-containing protein [Hymenobacter elongatus]